MRRSLVMGLAIATVQAAIVASVAVQYAVQRERLPRAWVQAVPGAVADPVRGRYLRVPVLPVVDAGVAPRIEFRGERRIVHPAPVVLEARNGGLLAHTATTSHVRLVPPPTKAAEGPAVLWPPVEYFVPASLGDPNRLINSGELWLEVSVPRQGGPRPLRLGIMRNGRIEALAPGMPF